MKMELEYTSSYESYPTTQAFGKYYFIVKADMRNEVYEYMAELNNTKSYSNIFYKYFKAMSLYTNRRLS